jgi:hypothetical protein
MNLAACVNVVLYDRAQKMREYYNESADQMTLSEDLLKKIEKIKNENKAHKRKIENENLRSSVEVNFRSDFKEEK